MKNCSFINIILLLLLMSSHNICLSQSTNLLSNGDLEVHRPAFWNKLNNNLGNSLVTWAEDDAAPNPNNNSIPSFRSFKIQKSEITSHSVGWVSENFAQLYWNNAGSGLYDLSFYAKTSNVNINPASIDSMIGVWFKFFGNGLLLDQLFLKVDQSKSNTDWIKYDALSQLSLREAPDSICIELVMNKNAIGTVWFDNIYCNTAGSSSMIVFNDDAETPLGWMYWIDTQEYNFCGLINDPTAHSGNYSALLYEKDNSNDEMVFYSEPVPIEGGEWYKFSCWVKTDSVNQDTSYIASNVIQERIDERAGFTILFHYGSIRRTWDVRDGDYLFYIDQRNTTSDWTYYTVAVQAPLGATGASFRARLTSFPWGYYWYDDFSIEKITLGDNILPNGDLELREPAFWQTVNDGLGGAECIWAADTAAPNPWNTDLPSQYSLKVVKPSVTTAEVGWKASVNNATLYWNSADVNGTDITWDLKFYAKTEGTNTNPANENQKIRAVYSFYSGQTLLNESIIALDQSVSSTNWREYVVPIFVAGTPDSIAISLVMGMDATGTVWFDNIDCNSQGTWIMSVFNGTAETPSGWMHWTSDVLIGYANIVDDQFYEGNYSALLYEPDNFDDEMVIYSEPVEILPGDWYRFSAWVKTDSTNTDFSFIPSNVITDRINDRAVFDILFHTSPIRTEWVLAEPERYFYIDQRQTNQEWTLYSVITQAPFNAAGASFRGLLTPFPYGFYWYDNFAIEHIDIITPVIQQENKITFQVDMSVMLRTYQFQPQAGDVVALRGNFLSMWTENSRFFVDEDQDSVYTVSLNVTGNSGENIEYKFVIVRPDSNVLWESDISNRLFQLTGLTEILPVVYFNDDLIGPPQSAPRIMLQNLDTGELGGDIPINYSISDIEGDPVDLNCSYSINSGNTWYNATISGDTTDLDPDMYNGNIIWHSEQDLPGYDGVTVRFKITPYDSDLGLAAITSDFHLDNNYPPTLTLGSVSPLPLSKVKIPLYIDDKENDRVYISARYKIGISDWLWTYLHGDNAYSTNQFVDTLKWFSSKDLNFGMYRDVQLRIYAMDNDTGSVVTTDSFNINNYAGDYTGDVVINYDDLIEFALAWQNQDLTREIGPATGTPPLLIPQADGVIDFEDLMVLVLQWNWSYDHPDGMFKPLHLVDLKQLYTSGEPLRFDYFLQTQLPKMSDFTEDLNSHLLRIEQSYYDPWTENFGDELVIALDTVCQVLGIELYYGFSDKDAFIDEYEETLLKGNIGITLYGRNEQNGVMLFNTIVLENQTGKQSDELMRFHINDAYKSTVPVQFGWRIHDTRGTLICSGSRQMELQGHSITPSQYALYQNFPNPFNASTVIRYQLPVAAHLKMEIYNILGEHVTTLIDEQQKAGYHQKLWEVNEPFNTIASGLYFLNFEALGNDGSLFTKSQKMIVLK